MDKKKQIEEIKSVLIKTCKRVRSFQTDYMQDRYAEAIYEADYRKQSNGVWKFNKSGSGTCSECGMTQKNVWDYDGFQRFCGCCGAKMKGGVE